MENETKAQLTCNVTTDLMALYTTGKTSPETNELIEAHLHTCTACAQAFAREPQVREQVEMPPAYEPTDLDNLFDWLKYHLLPVWGFLLYLFSRFLNWFEPFIRRFGRSTTTLKIRVYRARRKVSGMMARDEAAAEPVAVTQ